MEVSFLLQALLNGVMTASVYILIALGLTMIFGLLRVVNFAHSEFYMLGGFAAWIFFERLGLNYFLTLILAMVLLFVLGMAIERTIFRPVESDILLALMVSLGLGWVLQMGALFSFGTLDKGVRTAFPGMLNFLGVRFTMERLMVMVLAAALVAGLFLFMQRSKLGQAMRAVAQDREAAALQGINVSTISSLGFGMASALAAGAGVLIAPLFVVNPFMGLWPLIKGFIIIIVGGMGSIPGAVLAGLLLGTFESFTASFASQQLADVLGFMMVIVVLILRPQGLLGRAR